MGYSEAASPLRCALGVWCLLVNKLGGFNYDVISKWKERKCEAY